MAKPHGESSPGSLVLLMGNLMMMSYTLFHPDHATGKSNQYSIQETMMKRIETKNGQGPEASLGRCLVGWKTEERTETPSLKEVGTLAGSEENHQGAEQEWLEACLHPHPTSPPAR
jgi:hypothetical protein